MLNVSWSQDNSRGAALKSAAVKSMNVWNRQYNPHVSICASMKQHSGTWGTPVTHSSQLKCLSLLRRGHNRWSVLTYSMLCSMSGAAVGSVSLIYNDKGKHIKNQPHAAHWLGTAYHERFTISSEYKTFIYYIVIHLSCCLLDYSVALTLCPADSKVLQPSLNVRGRQVSVLPRNLWINVTTLLLTTFSKCLLNKDVVPCTLNQGAKSCHKSDVGCSSRMTYFHKLMRGG